MILGWYLYVSMTLPVGSTIFLELWFMIQEFSYTSNVETVFFLKKNLIH